MTENRSARARRLVLRVALAASLFAVLVLTGRLDLRALGAALWSRQALAVAATQAAVVVLGGVRWGLLLRTAGLRLRPGDVGRAVALGQFATMFLPAIGGTEAARLVTLERAEPGCGPAVAATLAADRLAGLGGIALSALVASLFAGWRAGGERARAMLLLAVVVAVGVVAGGAALLVAARLLRGRSGRIAGLFARVSEGLDALAGRPGVLLVAVALTLVSVLVAAVGSWVSLEAIGRDAPFAATLLPTPLILLSAAAPFVPMGLGVSESVAEAAYAIGGIPGGAASMLLGRATYVAVSAACGLVMLVPARRAAEDLAR